MRLDYEELAECVDRLIGTTKTVEEVAAEVSGVDAGQIENLDTINRAAPVCVACEVRGHGSAMTFNPDTGLYVHGRCV